MNSRRFHHDLIRGLGSCVLAVQADPARWFDQVLWACGREISYDPQCNGTHAEYLMEMIACYDDWTPFFDAVYPCVCRYYHHPGWKFDYCANLLALMAAAGYAPAQDAIETIRSELLALLRTATRRDIPFSFPAWENYEHMTVVLLTGKPDGERAAFCRCVFRECGALLRENPALSDWWSWNDWFRCVAEDLLGAENFRAVLDEEDPDIARYRAAVLELEAEREKNRAERERDGTAEAARRRIRARSNLSYTPCEEDRASALRQLAAGEQRGEAVSLLLKNYRPEDEAILLRTVRALPFRREAGDWHAVIMSVNDELDKGVPLPDSLLLYLYRENLCDTCRRHLVEHIAARGLLTPPLREECLHDSNDEVVSIAADV